VFEKVLLRSLQVSEFIRISTGTVQYRYSTVKSHSDKIVRPNQETGQRSGANQLRHHIIRIRIKSMLERLRKTFYVVLHLISL
jgi:hypothetical protein